MDDIERLRRRRTIKVLITDLFMATSVVAIVIILVAAVAGWRINSDFTVEQNGLVSIKTKPTGANVIIDDEPLYQTTNMSKMLSGGKHKVVLEKDGYERWEKEVEITPGWLLRLEYPRLFKQNRTKNTVKEFDGLSFFYVSPDRTTVLFSEDNTTTWSIITDLGSKPKIRQIDVKGIFDGTDEGYFNLKIDTIEWSKNNERILINVVGNETVGNAKINIDEWGIINIKDVKESINLSNNYSRYEANSKNILATAKKETQKKIIQAKFENEAGDKILANVSGSLIHIDTNSKTINSVVAKSIESFTLLDQTILYKTAFENEKSYLELLRIGEKNPTIVATNSNKKAKISFEITRFNSTSYLLYTIDNHLFVYRANDFPTGGSKFNMKPIIDTTIGIISSEANTSHNKEFIILREGSRSITFDTELEKYYEYDYGDEEIRFLDDYLLFRVDKASGTLLTWDFDSTNVRTLVVDKAVHGYDALISSNNKYLYYIAKNIFTDEEGNSKTILSLVQEDL